MMDKLGFILMKYFSFLLICGFLLYFMIEYDTGMVLRIILFGVMLLSGFMGLGELLELYEIYNGVE
jgi:hypothetical protein